jgi:hypothetical protein
MQDLVINRWKKILAKGTYHSQNGCQMRNETAKAGFFSTKTEFKNMLRPWQSYGLSIVIHYRLA